MEISLSSELKELIDSSVESGRYPSVDEVLREALSLLQERDMIRERRTEELRKFVAVGVEQADRGETGPLDVDATLARVRARKAGIIEES